MRNLFLLLVFSVGSFAGAESSTEKLTERQTTRLLNEISSLDQGSNAKIKYHKYLAEVQKQCRANSEQTYLKAKNVGPGHSFRIITHCDTKPGNPFGSMVISVEIGFATGDRLDASKASFESFGIGE